MVGYSSWAAEGGAVRRAHVCYLQIDGAVAVNVVHAKRPLELFVGSSSRRHVDRAQKFLFEKKIYIKKENVVFNLKGCGNKESKGVEKKKKRGENYTAANSLARWLITVIKNKLLLLLLLLLLGKGIINVVRATAQLVPGTTTRKRKGGWKTTVVWTRLIGNR